MALTAEFALRELDRRKAEFERKSCGRKLELLSVLEKHRLRRAKDAATLHEALCFLRAYPDDAVLLEQVERMLAAFDRRSDLRKHRTALADTGIAGTTIDFPFFAPSAHWLARTCGQNLSIDWSQFENNETLDRLLPMLALYTETPALDESTLSARQWIQRMKNPDETDAAFLLRRLEQLSMDSPAKELVFEELDLSFRLKPGPTAPSRTREKYTDVKVHFQSKPLDHVRPTLAEVKAARPRSVRAVSPRDGRRLVDLARSCMATRSRDLDSFAYGDSRDVRLVDCGQGLTFAYIGMIPERRLLLETVYGFLMLKNGVPVGYGTDTALFGSSELAFTVFDTFRHGETAQLFAWVLSIGRHVHGSDTFTITPYQLGEDNEDAIQSGAWWFYQKFGFEPRDSQLRRIMRTELGRMKKERGHRSSPRTLRKLASANVFLHLGKPREDVLGVLPLANVGMQVTRYLAENFGFDRNKAEDTCAKEAARMLGVRTLSRFSTGERLAWRRWAPLLVILPGRDRWNGAEKRALVQVVRAKGGRSEVEYVRRFDAHKRLKRAIKALAAPR